MGKMTRPELIRALRPKAEAVAWLLKHQRDFARWGGNSDFNSWPGNPEHDPAAFHFKPKGEIEFRHRWAGVEFANFRPHTKGGDVTIHPPVFADSDAETVSMHLNTFDNPTSGDSEAKVTYARTMAETSAQEIAHSVGVALSVTSETTIGGGSKVLGASVEQKISATLESSYGFSKTSSVSSETSDTSGTEYTATIPGGKSVSIALVSKIGKGEITIEATGFLDMSVRVWSHGDYEIMFPSLESLENWLVGYGDADLKHHDVLRRNPYAIDEPHVVTACSPFALDVKTTTKFDKALSTRVQETELPLSKTA